MKDYFGYHTQVSKLLNKDSFYDELYFHFCKELISYDATCKDLVEAFASHYFIENTRLEKKDAIEVSTNFFALITSDFTDEMDFSSEHWDFIKYLILSYQNELSVEVLNTVLGVLIMRKKIVF